MDRFEKIEKMKEEIRKKKSKFKDNHDTINRYQHKEFKISNQIQKLEYSLKIEEVLSSVPGSSLKGGQLFLDRFKIEIIGDKVILDGKDRNAIYADSKEDSMITDQWLDNIFCRKSDLLKELDELNEMERVINEKIGNK